MIERKMLSFREDNRLFSMRAAAIIERDGALLVQRNIDEDFWALPGGRVEMGEAGAETLMREMREELGVDARVGALHLLIENFFSYGGVDVHELGLYYRASLDDSFPFLLDEPCHRLTEGAVTLEFAWVRNNPEVLADIGLYPETLRAWASRASEYPVHLVVRE